MTPELNRIYKGDCREIMREWPDDWVDMIWTDPPYGHGNNNGKDLHSVVARGGFGKYKETPYEIAAIENDDADSMREVVDAMLTEAARILKPDCCCCCCCGGGGGPRPTFAWLATRMDTAGFQFFHSVIWDKINPGLGWRYKRQHEMVMVAHRKGGKLAWNEDAEPIGNIIRKAKPHNGFHPNEKPTELVGKMIGLHTKPGDIILDPFCGSGTTLLAAERLGRRWIGIEMDQDFIDVAQKRLLEETNQGKLF